MPLTVGDGLWHRGAEGRDIEHIPNDVTQAVIWTNTVYNLFNSEGHALGQTDPAIYI